MSQRQIIRLLVSFLICIVVSSDAAAQNCTLSGEAAWNKTLLYIDPDCAHKFPSPNRRLTLKVSSGGSISITGMSIQLAGHKIEPPAMLSWSPRSDVFFINDGEGSGMSSKFRLFRLKGNRVYEDKAVARAAVSLYRRRIRCSRSAIDPNVWGFGWDTRGKNIYLLVQSTVNEPCGDTDQFISLIVRTSDGKILETLSYKQTQARFAQLLPASIFDR